MEILESSSGDGIYLKHKAKDKLFWLGESFCEFTHMIIDPATAKTGWGMYDGQYHWKWDDVLGQKSPQPDKEWCRAFGVVVMVDSEDKPLIYQRQSWGEWYGFLNMLQCYYNDVAKNAPKLPVLEWTGSVEKGRTAVPQFKLAKWTDRPDAFVIPAEYSEDFDKVNTTSQASEEEPKITQDDIPF